jgi:hypothetical protein
LVLNSRNVNVETDCGEAIVRRTRECDEVYFLIDLVDGHFAGVADGDFEEGGSLLRHIW